MKRKTRRGLLGLAVAIVGLAVAAAWWGLSDRGSRPTIVLITIESLRTDHVQCYDGTRAASPALDALAAEGVLYTDAHSVTSWTLASHASIFTGLYPTAHQTTGPLDKLDTSYRTIAEVLADAGYQTAAVVSGPYLRREHQLDQGFEHFDAAASSISHQLAHGDITNERLHQGLESFLTGGRDAERPLFLFAYYWDVHYDYLPPAPYDQTFVTPECETIDLKGYGSTRTVHAGIRPGQLAYVKSQYDGEILCTNDYLQRLFDTLKKEGLWEDALVIVTADHGEEFFDHGQKGHKNNLHAESLHVPLIIKWPHGSRTGRDDRVVSHVDILPTILDVTGSSYELPLHGVSLLDTPPTRPVHHELLEIWYTQVPGKTEVTETRRTWYAVREGDLKYIANDRGVSKLYDVKSDPREMEDLAATRAPDVVRLQGIIESWLIDMQICAKAFRRGGMTNLSAADLERLRSLGYIRD